MNRELAAAMSCVRVGRARALFLTCAIMTASWGCERSHTRDSSASSRKDVTPRAPRFWLTPGPALPGATRGVLSAPLQHSVLVELLPTGRIRTPDSKDLAAEAELPRDSQSKAEGRGLALYVQERADLHYGAPDGPVFGRLHPGALVRVAVAGEGSFLSNSSRVRVGSIGPSFGAGQTAAFCDRKVLSTKEVPLSEYQPEPGSEALRSGFNVWGTIPNQSETLYNVSFSPCYDTFVLRKQHLLRQYIEGVETFGEDIDHNLDSDSSIVARSVSWCTGRVVTQGPGTLLLHRPGFEPQGVAQIPAGYEVLTRPQTNVEPLSSRVRAGRGELYWIVATEGKLFCSGWRFKKFTGPRENRDDVPLPKDLVAPVLTGKLESQEAMDGKGLSYPIEYVPPTPHQAAQLWFGSLRWGGNRYLNCSSCESNYTVLKTLKDELWVSNRVLPDDVLAFDPNEKERWFFSRVACEAALAGARAELQRSPTSGTRLGIHARSNIVPH
ncbi:MAG TPA: hypothetical protein VFQ61_01850 [Polyangiaceae bacterium]|nr:hypothetical protein [Polyangiaceae bacterium]